MRFRFLATYQAQWPTRLMGEVLNVSRSGYDAWRQRPPSARGQRQRELVQPMRQIHAEKSKACDGSRRRHRELVARGRVVCENTVAQLMQAHGLHSTAARKFRHTTDSHPAQPVAENRLKQEFAPARPNQAWVSDITYVPTREGWLYRVCVRDRYSRMVVGWSMSARMTSELVLSALQRALGRRCPASELLHHWDRGSQYCSAAFERLLQAQGITCSMSSKGNCDDNAVMASCFATLKTELVHGAADPTRAAARQSLFESIETFSNRERRHSALESARPEQYEPSA